MSKMVATLETRFWKYVVRAGPDDCWLWQGSLCSLVAAVYETGGDQ